MTTRWILLVFVALLVVIAGCSGADVEAGDTSGSDDPTTAGTGSGYGPGEETDSADDEAGGDAVDAVIPGDPAAILDRAGSFTGSWSYEFLEDEAMTTAYEYSVAVDLVANHSFETSRFSDQAEDVVFERYNAAGQSYMRYGSGEESVFMSMPQEGDPVGEALSDAFVGDVEDYTRVGTETFDGVSVTRYEYADPLLWRSYGLGTVDEDEMSVTDFVLVVLVDEDGLARSTSWSLEGVTTDGERIVGEWRYQVTEVGTTVVDEPDWLETAKTQSAMG